MAVNVAVLLNFKPYNRSMNCAFVCTGKEAHRQKVIKVFKKTVNEKLFMRPEFKSENIKHLYKDRKKLI